MKLRSTLAWHDSSGHVGSVQCLSRRSFLSQKLRRIYPFLARLEGVGERRRLGVGAVLDDDELLLLCSNSELVHVSVGSAIAN